MHIDSETLVSHVVQAGAFNKMKNCVEIYAKRYLFEILLEPNLALLLSHRCSNWPVIVGFTVIVARYFSSSFSRLVSFILLRHFHFIGAIQFVAITRRCHQNIDSKFVIACVPMVCGGVVDEIINNCIGKS